MVEASEFYRKANYLESVVRVYDNYEELELSGFRGTAFAFQSDHHPLAYVTAAHVVGDLEVGTSLFLQGGSGGGNATLGAIHESADIALLTKRLGALGVEPHPLGPPKAARWGDDVLSVGFPLDVLGENSVHPPPVLRIFKGHIQRLVAGYEPPFNKALRYDAAELSFAAPRGLSGAPVMSWFDGSLIGVVTENQRSESNDGVIQYGITALIDPVLDWINDELAAIATGKRNAGEV